MGDRSCRPAEMFGMHPQTIILSGFGSKKGRSGGNFLVLDDFLSPSWWDSGTRD